MNSGPPWNGQVMGRVPGRREREHTRRTMVICTLPVGPQQAGICSEWQDCRSIWLPFCGWAFPRVICQVKHLLEANSVQCSRFTDGKSHVGLLDISLRHKTELRVMQFIYRLLSTLHKGRYIISVTKVLRATGGDSSLTVSWIIFLLNDSRPCCMAPRWHLKWNSFQWDDLAFLALCLFTHHFIFMYQILFYKVAFYLFHLILGRTTNPKEITKA